MQIRVRNNQADNAQGFTYLSVAGTASQTIFDLKNTNGFEANLVAQIGETGHERTENLLISGAPASGKGTVTAGAAYSHPVDTPVYCYRFDQIIFKRSTDGTAGTATAMTDGTITITPDSLETVFEDANAATGYAYKTQYKNSVSSAVSPESDWITFEGFPAYSLAGMRQRIRNKIPEINEITDDMIHEWINEWRQEMTNAANQVNEDWSLGTVDVAFSGTAQEGTITAFDYVSPVRVWQTTNGIEWFKSTKTDYNRPYPDQVFNSTNPMHYFKSDNVIGRLPAETSGTLRITYDSLGTAMENDSDLLPYSMRGFSKSFIDYGLAQVSRRPEINDKAEASKMEDRAYAQREDFVTKISPRDNTGPEYVDIVETIGETDSVAF